MDICSEINFQIAPEKMVWAITIIVFLGILIDAKNQTLAIPIEKRLKALNKIEEILNKKTVMILQLQKLTRLLNFLSRAIIPHETFMRCMYCKYSHMDLKQPSYVKVDAEMKADCKMWKYFLIKPESLCRPFMDFTTKLTADGINFFTDASCVRDKCFGCIFDEQWTHSLWEDNFMNKFNPSIEYLELYALTVAIELWADKLQNKRVIILCDNQVVVEQTNKVNGPISHKYSSLCSSGTSA